MARAFDFDPGLGTGIRAGIRVGPTHPFLAVAVAGWLRRQRAVLTGAPNSAEIPRFEVLLQAGIGLGNFF